MQPLLRMQVALLAATAASATVSVFAAQVGLALVALVFFARIARKEAGSFALPVDAAVSAFAIWTFMSAAFAPSPVASHESAKKLVLFFLLYFAAEALRAHESRETLLDGMLMGGIALSSLAILQYFFLGFDTMDNRPRSFLGHYMTTSGVIAIVLMIAAQRLFTLARPVRVDAKSLGVCALLVGGAAAVALSRATEVMTVEVERLTILGIALLAGRRAFRGLSWPGAALSDALALVMAPLGAFALLLSRTRSAWLGVVAGLAVLAWIKRPRLLVLLPALVGGLLVFAPRTFIDRLTVTDASSRDRYYMWQAGLDMIMDKPIFGQGTGMILSVYPKFRWQGAPNPNAPHLHNNFIQIAAERGLPCLAFFTWLLFLLGREAWRARETSRSGPVVLSVLTATLVSGLFEYTLGDSEILMLILLLTALPYAVRSSPEERGVAALESTHLKPASADAVVFEQ